MSSVPYSVGNFASEFEYWPLPPDEEALTLPGYRPPGYFDCDDIALPTPKEAVERGMATALVRWADWEGMHMSPGMVEGQKLVRLPPGIKLKEHETEGERAVRIQSHSEKLRGLAAKEATSIDVNSSSHAKGKAAGLVAGASGVRSASGGGGGDSGCCCPPSTAGEESPVGPDKETMLEILDLVPDLKRAETQLLARMRASQLALGRWRIANELEGGGMRDFRRLPFLRKTVNVVQAPAHVGTMAEAGTYAVQDDEAMVTITTFGHRASMLYRYQDYMLLARNTLGDLHRMIYCTLAAVLAKENEQGNVPEELNDNLLAFFFIEGKFYATLRRKEGDEKEEIEAETEKEEEEGRSNERKENLDFIDAIIAWVNERGKDRRMQLGLSSDLPIEVLDMETVQLADLSLRLGTRYLYCHLGECEHHFNVSDVRLPSPEDPRDGREYPLLVFQKHYRKRRCMACDVRPAKFCVLGDPVGDDHKMVYCEFCHYLLHYDAQGHLLRDDFEVFPYIHDD
ncbi:snrna-activating protein complex subunit 3-like [Nannochloropsis oceanica]